MITGQTANSTTNPRRAMFVYAGLALICAGAVFLALQSGNMLRYKDEIDYSQLADRKSVV